MQKKRSRVVTFVLLPFALVILFFMLSWDDFYVPRMKTYSIPSNSMIPGLQVGDYVIAKRVFSSIGEVYDPRAGDLIVFDPPAFPGTPYLKRVVGPPGDSVQMIDGGLVINGEPVKRERIDDYAGQPQTGDTEPQLRFRETLPNGVSYNTLDLTTDGQLDNTREYLVPEGHVFVMGDNRDFSVDSRVFSKIGYIPVENVIGIVDRLIYLGATDEFVWRPVEVSTGG